MIIIKRKKKRCIPLGKMIRRESTINCENENNFRLFI